MKRKNRNLAQEIMEGLEAYKAHLEGKITLRTTTVEPKPEIRVAPESIKRLRERLNISAGVLARLLRVQPRTLEKWEQSKAPIKGTSALLLALVEKYPDTLDRLETLDDEKPA
ncbi:MAG: transcriptional regulator [Candidatus Riflebacteria bacterium]|nr:transcriptional regulator [Candidatus Riflebacteria bacterium]